MAALETLMTMATSIFLRGRSSLDNVSKGNLFPITRRMMDTGTVGGATTKLLNAPVKNVASTIWFWNNVLLNSQRKIMY